MMSDEIMVPVNPKCIPDGCEPLRFGIPEEGEFIVQLTQFGGVILVRVQPKEVFSTPRLIVRKKYDPGIDCIPKGWWVWQQLDANKSWVATPSDGGYGDYVAIYGLQNLLGFVPPPDGKPRKII